MRRTLSIDRFVSASQGLYILLIFSMVYSMYMITITNILLLLLGIYYLSQHYKEHTWNFSTVGLLMLGFLPYLQGLFLSDNLQSALIEVQHNLSYLSIPLAVLLLPALNQKQTQEIFAFFILLMCISSIPVLLRYWANPEQSIELLGKGQAISTPIDHVRYSILLSFACVYSFISFLKNRLFFTARGRTTYLIMALFLFATLHVLAVRTGIILAYAGLLISGCIVLILQKRVWLAFLLVIFIISVPITAYFTLPSFHKKVHYALYDYNQQQKGEGAFYSDSERLRSYNIGLDIWKENKIIGVGTGDLKAAVESQYAEKYPGGGKAILPHNQFIKLMASSGLIGLIAFIISFYMPFLIKVNKKKVYLLCAVSMLTISFFIEATLERSYMLAFSMLVLSLLYNLKEEDAD